MWDFRAASLSHPDHSIASVHQVVEGAIQLCFNIIVFKCPMCPRSKPVSVNVEEFIISLREFVDSKLGRLLPDFQTYGLNWLFAILERICPLASDRTRECTNPEHQVFYQ